MNRVLWAGLIVMAVAVLLYLGDLLTTYTRPMLTGIAAVGALLFIAGGVMAFLKRGRDKQTPPPAAP